jgi:hypothetical protein
VQRDTGRCRAVESTLKAVMDIAFTMAVLLALGCRSSDREPVVHVVRDDLALGRRGGLETVLIRLTTPE